MARRQAVTDKEKLQFSIDATVTFEFGTACDFIKTLGLPEHVSRAVEARIRTMGNRIMRIASNHVDAYNVTHKTPPADARALASRIRNEG